LPVRDELVYLNDKVQEYLPEHLPFILNLWMHAMIFLMRRSFWLRQRLLDLEMRLFRGNALHGNIFEHYKPDLVVTCSPGYYTHDTYLLREARFRGVRTVAVIFGWDKSVARGVAGARTDAVVVWSQSMKQEMIAYQGYKPHQVFVGGVATFDQYWDKRGLMKRSELMSHFGLDPNKRLLVFGGKSPYTYPNHGILEILAEAAAKKRFVDDVQIIARLHPNYFKPDAVNSGKTERLLNEYYRIQSRYPNLVALSIPKVRSQRLRMDLDPEELPLAGSLVCQADVLVTLFSTLQIEACICDTPVVNVCFDPKLPLSRKYFKYRPIAVDMKQPHNLRVQRSQATRLAYTPKQLIDEINRYLQHPHLERIERRRFAEEECGPLDGRAGERIGQFLLRMAYGHN
jgi:hypothetical protein